MPLSTWNLEWLNHNSQRKYPLADDASGYDATGTFQLPNDFIVQLDLPIHSAMDMDPSHFFIRQIISASTGYSIVVSYNQPSDGSVVDVATAHIPTVSHTTEYKTYVLGGMEPFDDTVGKVTINNLAAIASQPAGLWTFIAGGSGLTPDAIRPIIQGVQSLSVSTGGATPSQRIYGDVELVAGDNIKLTLSDLDTNNPEIRIDAIEGVGLTEECQCEGDVTDIPCIKTINGISPTPEGQFYLVGDDCLTMQSGTNAVEIEDTCCSPCCGCTELEVITKDLERFLQQQVNLEVFVNDLRASVTEMSLTVLGSRLGDRGCITCE